MVFSGRAIYDTGVFNGIAEDVSELVAQISPSETDFLSMLGDSEVPAENVLHSWIEDALVPVSIVTSTAVGSTTAASSVTVGLAAGGSVAPFLQVGMVLMWPAGEYSEITAISGDDVTFSRAKAGTTATSYGAGVSVEIISTSELEGADATDDVSRPRSRPTNYCQLFKKDVIVSGTIEAVTQLGGISDEFSYQKGQRLAELLRDLERAVLRGKSFSNTLGSSTERRKFAGVSAQITTNVTSCGSPTQALLDAAIKAAWENGGFKNKRGLILADSVFKGQIDTFNNSRIRVNQPDAAYRQNVMVYENTYGEFEVMLGRNMAPNQALILSPERVKVKPLKGRSFQFKPVAPTGDSTKGTLVGEYTVEVHNQNGMSKLWNGIG